MLLRGAYCRLCTAVVQVAAKKALVTDAQDSLRHINRPPRAWSFFDRRFCVKGKSPNPDEPFVVRMHPFQNPFSWPNTYGFRQQKPPRPGVKTHITDTENLANARSPSLVYRLGYDHGRFSRSGR